MAIKFSGPLTFSEIQAEFGGVPGYGLSEWYPIGTQVAGIPTSGTIKMSDFYGKSATATATNVVTRSVSGLDNPVDSGQGKYGSGAGHSSFRDYWIEPIPQLELQLPAGAHVTTVTTSYSMVLDWGFNMFYNINNAGWVHIGRLLTHFPGGASMMSGSTGFTLNTANGANIKIAYSTGPSWQNYITNGQITVNYTQISQINAQIYT